VDFDKLTLGQKWVRFIAFGFQLIIILVLAIVIYIAPGILLRLLLLYNLSLTGFEFAGLDILIAAAAWAIGIALTLAGRKVWDAANTDSTAPKQSKIST